MSGRLERLNQLAADGTCTTGPFCPNRLRPVQRTAYQSHANGIKQQSRIAMTVVSHPGGIERCVRSCGLDMLGLVSFVALSTNGSVTRS
jgi:hypothetical protein